jgi:hypothetical protein
MANLLRPRQRRGASVANVRHRLHWRPIVRPHVAGRGPQRRRQRAMFDRAVAGPAVTTQLGRPALMAASCFWPTSFRKLVSTGSFGAPSNSSVANALPWVNITMVTVLV